METSGHTLIFMPLRTGSLSKIAPLSLTRQDQNAIVMDYLAPQMRSALDYLSSHGLCHRDVKPDNILYGVVGNRYIYQLADFGLANCQQRTRTICGTWAFTATETFGNYGRVTPKADVWSLFVTILDVIAETGFSALAVSRYDPPVIHQAVMVAAGRLPLPYLALLGPMAI
jgi:serine/threonine protein kinase